MVSKEFQYRAVDSNSKPTKRNETWMANESCNHIP